MQAWVDWLVTTRASYFILDSAWAWPISEALHFMGLVLLVGTVSLFDLRVLGVGKGIAPAAIHRLVPLGMVGFIVSLATGLMFIAGMPDQYFYNSAFHLKLVFLVLMALNVAFFYSVPYRIVRGLGSLDEAPRVAKVSALLSLAFMIGVMCCGRMLTFFRPPSGGF